MVQSKSSKLKSVPFLLGTTLAVTSILTITGAKRVRASILQGSEENAAPATQQVFKRGRLPVNDLISQAEDAEQAETAEPDTTEPAAEESEDATEPTEGSAPVAPIEPAVPSPSLPPVAPVDEPTRGVEVPITGDEPPTENVEEEIEAEVEEEVDELENEIEADDSEEEPAIEEPPAGEPPVENGAPTTPTDSEGLPAAPPGPGAPEAPAFPPPPPDGAPTPGAEPGAVESTEPEPEVLVSEVAVEGADGDLALTVYEAISTRPGQPS
ncbi:MAG: hypothetical protein AAF329_15225, partial [Cyanobacteria bacterium P01_A01_bin.17]